MTTDTHRSQYRLPWELYDKLKTAAEQSGRSVNAEMVARLEASFDQEGDLSGKLDWLLKEVQAIREEIKGKP